MRVRAFSGNEKKNARRAAASAVVDVAPDGEARLLQFLDLVEELVALAELLDAQIVQIAGAQRNLCVGRSDESGATKKKKNVRTRARPGARAAPTARTRLSPSTISSTKNCAYSSKPLALSLRVARGA